MSYLGIDVGTSHTKVVEIYNDGKAIHLVKFAIFPSNHIYRAFQESNYSDVKPAVAYFKKMLNDAGFGTNKASITLPDHKILCKVLEIPYIEGPKNIQQAVEFVAEDQLPLPLSEMTLKYTVIKEKLLDANKQDATSLVSKLGVNTNEKKGLMDVLIVAAPKKLVENYMFVANKVGLEVATLEPNSLSSAKIFHESQKSVPTVVVNIGYSYTDIYLVIEGNVRFIRNIKFGVNVLIQKLSEDLNLSTHQANTYVYTYGFNSSQLNGKIKELLEPIMDILSKEIIRFIEYAEQRIKFNDTSDQNKINRLIIAGGGALIPNIIVYLINKMSIEVQYADSWKKIDIELIQEKSVLKIIGPIFSSAVGSVIELV